MKNTIDNVEVIDEIAVNEESNKRYLFFDIESATGSKGCICEFGYVITNENLEIIEERNILMNPKCEFSWRVLRKILKKDKRVYESQKGFTSHYDFIKKLVTTSDLVFGFATVNDVIYLNDDTPHKISIFCGYSVPLSAYVHFCWQKSNKTLSQIII